MNRGEEENINGVIMGYYVETKLQELMDKDSVLTEVTNEVAESIMYSL